MLKVLTHTGFWWCLRFLNIHVNINVIGIIKTVILVNFRNYGKNNYKHLKIISLALSLSPFKSYLITRATEVSEVVFFIVEKIIHIPRHRAGPADEVKISEILETLRKITERFHSCPMYNCIIISTDIRLVSSVSIDTLVLYRYFVRSLIETESVALICRLLSKFRVK